jgi:hypothetical protein
MALNLLMVVIHAGGYYHLHIGHLLLMCRVAAVNIKYLAFSFLLLEVCNGLADYTMTSQGLLFRKAINPGSIPCLFMEQTQQRASIKFYTELILSTSDSDPT